MNKPYSVKAQHSSVHINGKATQMEKQNIFPRTHLYGTECQLE